MFQNFILFEMIWIFNEFPSFNLAYQNSSYQKSGETLLDRHTQNIIITERVHLKTHLIYLYFIIY